MFCSYLKNDDLLGHNFAHVLPAYLYIHVENSDQFEYFKLYSNMLKHCFIKFGLEIPEP